MALASRVNLSRNILRNLALSKCFYSGSVSKADAFWEEEGSVEISQPPAGSEPSPLLKKPSTESQLQNLAKNEGNSTFPTDFVRITKFGHVRLDSENLSRPEISESSNEVPPFHENVNQQSSFEITENIAKFPLTRQSQQLVKDSLQEKDVSKVEPKPELSNDESETVSKTSETMSALEYMRQIKKKKVLAEDGKITDKKTGVELNFDHPVDSQGYKTYSHLVTDLHNMTREMIVRFLKKSIVHHGNGIVALDKPYGMAVMDAEGFKSRHVLTEFLPDLSELLKCEKLYTVHRLDRDTTGILLLATDQSTASRLHEMFQKHKIRKTYWAITKGIPDPKQGTIDIPIAETTVLGKNRMKLRPVLPSSLPTSAKYNASGKSSKAVTHYNVIRFSGSASLVEIEPETGTKHQIRVHLSEALNCPILGDHKYSHPDKLAPQKLPQDMLDKLGVRQTKVRTIPMHLHAKTILLPTMGPNNSDLVIRADLPIFFKKSISALKLSPKK